jgi:DNA adenine methylase
MFSYVGGKYRQSKWIASFIPKNIKRYVEIFGGAMWVYIKGDFEAESVIYNDVNFYMANLFACCSNPEEFLPFLKQYEAQDENLFYKFRSDVLNYEKINKRDYNLAAKYAYLITQTFSGMMKENVKMIDLKGKYKSKYYSFINRLEDPKTQRRLKKIQAVNKSYEEIIEIVDSENTILYCDPPYYGTEKLYAFHNFSEEDHKNLADILGKIKGKFILSYYDYPQLSEWYPENKFIYERKEYKKASMAKNGKVQSVGMEVLIRNYKV